MNPADLRDQIEVFTQDRQSSDPHGQQSGTLYTSAGTRRARVKTTGGTDESVAGGERPRERITILLRPPTDITNTSEVEWRSDRYEVTNIQRTHRRKDMVEVTAIRG